MHLLAPLLLGATLAPHVGGIPTRARFETPAGVGNVVDASFEVVWLDNQEDLTGLFDFFYQPTNVPPDFNFMNCDGTLVCALDGTPIPAAQDFPISETTNRFAWDLTAVPSGSYFVYEITEDPPIPPIWSMTRGVVTVRHAGDALFPAVVVTEPDGLGDTVADAFAVQFTASGQGPLTAAIEWRAAEGDAPLEPLALGVAMSEGDDGLHRGCFVWDLFDEPPGYYYVRVTVTDAAARTHAAWSPSSVVVYRDPRPTDAGPPASCGAAPILDGGVVATDAASEPGATTGPCDCRVGGRGGRGARGGNAGAAGLTTIACAAFAAFAAFAVRAAARARRSRRAD